MRRRAKFIVQVRFQAERRWRNHTDRSNVIDAIADAESLRTLKRERYPYFPFPNVRLRYRGVTLGLWKDGSFNG